MFPKLRQSKKLIYLDYAATTPLDPIVKKTMEPFWITNFGNPSALYKQGREAKIAIERARKTIADILYAKPNEIIFTAGGTESINLAIFGVAKNFKPKAKHSPHFITSTIEHHAVLHCFDELERQGFAVTRIGVDSEGFVDVKKLEKAIRPETVLISIMYANNEIGTIQPIVEMGKLVKNINIQRQKLHPNAYNLKPILLHTDACQAAGSLDLNVQKLGVDLLSANGSKIYGPKQTGFLYVNNQIALKPLIHGGGQEKNIRSGTENVPGIVGLAKALELSQNKREIENKRLIELRDYLADRLFKKVEGISLNGPITNVIPASRRSAEASAKEDEPESRLARSKSRMTRLPNNLNITIKGIDGEALMLYLDSYNISVSTGSACTTENADPSHVLLALGKTNREAKSSLRITLGKYTTRKDLDYTVKVIEGLARELRKIKT